MGIVAEVKALEGKHFLTAFAVFCGTVCPGTLIMWHYNSALLSQLDILKLLLCSSALTAPVLILNVSYLLALTELQRIGAGFPFVVGAFVSAFVLYGALLVCYCFHLPFAQLLIAVAIGEACILLILVIAGAVSKRKEAKKNA